jgi:hypothetical protein
VRGGGRCVVEWVSTQVVTESSDRELVGLSQHSLHSIFANFCLIKDGMYHCFNIQGNKDPKWVNI